MAEPALESFVAQPLASQMPDSHDAPFEKAWYEISNLLIGNYAQTVSPKKRYMRNRLCRSCVRYVGLPRR